MTVLSEEAVSFAVFAVTRNAIGFAPSAQAIAAHLSVVTIVKKYAKGCQSLLMSATAVNHESPVDWRKGFTRLLKPKRNMR